MHSFMHPGSIEGLSAAYRSRSRDHLGDQGKGEGWTHPQALSR